MLGLAVPPVVAVLDTYTLSCWLDITLQPHASAHPSSATGWPSMMIVLSPSTIANTPLCMCGHVALSPTRATPMPSMSVRFDAVITRPPLDVGSPITIQFRAMNRFHC
ncbi:hypothetical protein G6F22_018263 [Rhizopus arrhizus]|nr:hypothetical protein G6F22_018263 [Rhizopus arrhizus]KAG1077430.1 hypothetical protein G6F40_017082 [Rhizopus arrhizus]